MNFFLYKYKFLILYILFGFLSLCIELVVLSFFLSHSFSYLIASFIGLMAGLTTAFLLNIRFNFHISKPRRKRALQYFTIISLGSFLLQFAIRKYLLQFHISMSESRFLISGLLFSFSYILHRRYTFKDYKKVGIAIYANGVDDIQHIYSKILNVCDFIHIDIVDKSFKNDCHEVKAYKAEVVRAFWQKKNIEVHIMSKYPSQWLNDLIPYVNTIYIHLNIEEDINVILDIIKKGGCNPGIVITMKDNVGDILKYKDKINHILLLAIQQPGLSGQPLDMAVLDKIEAINKLENRNMYNLCIALFYKKMIFRP